MTISAADIRDPNVIALDSGSHINARRQPRRRHADAEASKAALAADGCTP